VNFKVAERGELRSLLGERLDKIQTLAVKVIATTKAPKDFNPSANENTDSISA